MFRTMVAVSSSDVRGILRFLDTALATRTSDPLQRPTLAALQELIPAGLVEYFEMRRADCSLVAYSSDRDVDEPEWVPETLAVYGRQNPIGIFKWSPSDGPLRMSSVTSSRELLRSAWYDVYLRPLHISDTLKVWLWSSAESAACVSMNRSDGLFSDRDVAVLGVLQSHLISLRERRSVDPDTTREPMIRLTPREAEILTWAARGKRNDEIAHLLMVSPSTIAKHFENVYHKLGAHGRSDAIARLRTDLS